MFTAMRRQDRELGASETKEILLQGIYGILSMNSGSDYPYGIPLSYVYTGENIYFHAALEGQKLAYLRANNKVSFCVVAEAKPLPDQFSMSYKSAVLFGTACEVSGTEKQEALVKLIYKYAPDEDYIAKGKQYATASAESTIVFRLDIEHMTGKARK